MRFVLIDRVVELTPHQSISAVKNVSLAEEYLADHFPGFPVLPGVLMVEALVQAGAWLLRVSEEFAPSTVLLTETKAIRYNNFVAPGRTLQLDLTVRKRNGWEWEFQGQGTVEGKSAVTGRLTLRGFNLADRDPSLAAGDEARRQAYRELLPQLWAEASRPSGPAVATSAGAE